jgi:hypothetical protein
MQLLYPGFLWGLLAVSIPVAIHLLQLRRPQRVLFTNTGFIREVELTTMRRRRLQELLVLLARVLAVVLLVIMFCQPFIPAQQNVVGGEVGSAVEVLIDNSPSMRAQSESQGTLVQSAVVGAQTLGKSYGVNGRFQLLNQHGSAVTEALYATQLTNISETNGKASWGGPAVGRVLSGKSKQPLYIFSDFQKSEDGIALLKKAPADKKIVLVPQVARPATNVYVDSVWVEDAFIRTRANTGLHVRLKNGGSEVAADCPVKVFLGTKQVAAFRTTLGSGQTSATLVQLQLPDAKQALGRVVTEDTPITSDNTFYFTLQPTTSIRVIEIGAEPVARQAYSNEPLFVYSFAKPQEVNYSQLRRANLVLLDELMQVDAGLRQALVEVVRQGGSVVVVPTGQLAARESYHQFFRALGVGGEQWNAQANQPALQSIAMPSKENPFFKDVFGVQSRQVVMPQAAPVLSWGRNGADILRLQDGDSYLTQFESGSGKLYVFASPLAKAYSDFTSHALFVPVLYRLAMLSYHSDQRLAYRLTTSTVAVTLPVAQAAQTAKEDAGFRLVQDSAVFVPTQRVQGQELRLDVPAEMTKPGFYELRQQNKVVATLAFNADRREPELAAYSAAELRELIGPNRPNIYVLENGAKPEVLTHYRAEQTGQPLWRYCLVLALICLLVEALLLRFGRAKAPVHQPAVAG